LFKTFKYRAIHIDTNENNIVSLKNVTFTNVETKEYMINVSNGGRNKNLLI